MNLSLVTRHLSLQGRKALVVGLGDTGASCVRWLIEHDAEVRATDTRPAPPHADHLAEAFPEVRLTLGGLDPADFDWAELVVVSPGVALATPEIAAAARAGKDIVGDVELFARALGQPGPGSRSKVITITGSNGKSTVTSLVGHLCAAAGLDTVVAGNIGLPVLDAVAEREMAGRIPDAWVLELSSFQLETTSSLRPDAATVLNISEDHMDRYATLADYAAAKARVFADGVQVLNRDDAMVMAMAKPEGRIETFGLDAGRTTTDWGLIERDGRRWLAKGHERLFPVDELPIAGLHNAANALAALALCRAIGLKYEPMLAALRTFKGLAHRVEFVAKVAGRTFYDDSKGTNVGATAAALMGFAEPVVLIAGGDGKGQDFAPLRQAVRHARAVVQIGRDGPLVEAAIAGVCPVQRAETMAEAVNEAFRLSQPGDVVLLSPACASWDMFRNYAHRAEVFIAAVQALRAQMEARRVP
ncbi:MAG: UDP-N-acetylmuramoyl-L-alanine--D-glutamate ligase [Gallionellaceae bacterium]|nr:UDP-N-acetylmuramoyl-L-alanine--D-glutamate ligase [Gallionellaceae bacterium]